MVYRRTKKVDQKLEARLQAIMQAAREEFARNGFYGTSVKDIARRAGVGIGTIYLYLRNKEALFTALVNEAYGMVLERIAQARKNAAGGRQKLQVSMEAALAVLQENRDLARVMLVQSPAGHPEVAEHVYDLLRRLTKLVEEDVLEGIQRKELPPQDAQVAALAFVGTFYQVVISWLQEGIPSDLTAAGKELVAYNLRGLGYHLEGDIGNG
ncbi:TetR/AcrR family transcriptional regulator [Moorella sp. Hama-1]|uniref:TetR/AcrR family transcriptional regulator n=1 Tax=Moorella sp. Hama-1 TaxID=2138101 RepID=UPI000D64EED2|nr:TetR/AcrR family transcriptional regulator [Moorella sp. Hama-1]BCV21611.1 TetR family transcriptional regulator [Moorella sp. Hama-1]